MLKTISNPKFDKQTEAITAGLAVAYRKMLEFKQYKGTPVVVSENGQIKHLNPRDLLKSLEQTQEKSCQ